MFVSPRFRDIFSSRPLKTRRDDGAERAGSEPMGTTPRVSADASLDAEMKWLEITAAHRRAARVFTPEFLRIEELASGEP